MTFKSKQERQIIRQIILVPIGFVILFTFMSYLIINKWVMPNNEAMWESQLTKEYYENQKKKIVDESIKIYNLIIDERLELKEHLRLHLREQNEFFINFHKNNTNYISYSNLVYEVHQKEELQTKIKTTISNKKDFIYWIENKNKYFGYYSEFEGKYYLTYLDANEQLKNDRRTVLKKIMKLKFPQENYIFVLGYDGIIYGHHKKELIENPNLKDIDPRRYKNLNDIVSYAKLNGQSFLEYETGTKINPESFEDKISYLIPDEEWEIVIGFGLTKREISSRIDIEKKFKNKLVSDILLNLLIIVIIYIITHSIIMFLFGKIIARKFLEYKDISILEKEKTMQLLHEQNKYLAPKENIIDELVPVAILDENFIFKNCTQKFGDVFEINEDEIYGESLFKFLEGDITKRIIEFGNSLEQELEIKDALFKTFNSKDVWLSVKIKKENKEYCCCELFGYTIICEEVGEKLSLIKKYNREQEKNSIHEQIILQQSKLAAIGTTVDSIAHQWKQPLAVVLGEVSNLVLKARKTKNEDRTIDLINLQENIEKIEQTIKFLSETVEAFNTFYDAGEENVLIDVTSLIKDTFKIMIPSTSTNIYKIEYNVEDGVYAFGAKGLYQQVILTLIHNAIEAFNEKKIKNREFHVTVKNDGLFNECIIEDNAGGIKEEMINRIFELNFSTKKKNKLGNSGLGLFLASVVLREKFEEGTISVANVNNGAAFTIRTKNINLDEIN